MAWALRRPAPLAAAVILAALVVSCLAPSSRGLAGRSPKMRLPYRVVFLRQNLSGTQNVEDVRRVVERSSRLGFNGVVLAGDIDCAVASKESYRERLREVKAICDDHGMMLIPALFSVGYGAGIISHDRDLAAAVPLRDVPFVVEDGRGVLVEDPSIEIDNGGFERVEGHRLAGFDLQDEPGRVSFRDESERREGKSSLRLESFRAVRHGLGRVMQEVAVRPFRCYRISLRIKAVDLEPAGCFQIMVMTRDGRRLLTHLPALSSTGEWREVSAGFNSLDYDTVRVYAGVWGGSGGMVWIDDLRLGEVGLINVTRRPGTPVEVKNSETGIVYREGEDYERIQDTRLTFELDHDEIALLARPGGRIRDGDRLDVSCYQALSLGNGQVGVCMSEPRVYEIWAEVARLVHETASPDHYFLSMDEIRQGGWCEACTSRGLSAAEILGDCITRQCQILHGVNPDAEIFIWSDMLDPNHNATDRFFLFRGDFSGSWEHVPRDLIVACWYYDVRDESLRHFDEHGFRTLACGYYDSDDRSAVEGWMASLAKTPGSRGIMYTTWKNQYSFLDTFADVVRAHSSGKR